MLTCGEVVETTGKVMLNGAIGANGTMVTLIGVTGLTAVQVMLTCSEVVLSANGLVLTGAIDLDGAEGMLSGVAEVEFRDGPIRYYGISPILT